MLIPWYPEDFPGFLLSECIDQGINPLAWSPHQDTCALCDASDKKARVITTVRPLKPGGPFLPPVSMEDDKGFKS